MHSGLRSPFCAMNLRGSAVDSGSPLGEKRKAQHARTKVHSDKNHERLSQHEGSSTDDPSTCMLALTTHAILHPGSGDGAYGHESAQFVFILDCPCHRGASNSVHTVLTPRVVIYRQIAADID